MCLQKDQRTVYREEYQPVLRDVQGSNSYIKSTEVNDVKQHLSPSSLTRTFWKVWFRSWVCSPGLVFWRLHVLFEAVLGRFSRFSRRTVFTIRSVTFSRMFGTNGEGYNIQFLLKRVKLSLRNCLVLWRITPKLCLRSCF